MTDNILKIKKNNDHPIICIGLRTILTLFLLIHISYSYAMAATNAYSTVGLLVGASGLGDHSFNDMTYAGLIKAKKKYDLEIIYEDSRQDPALQKVAMQQLLDKGAGIIVANAFYLKDLVEEYAKRYPEVYFILQDAAIPDLPNVVSIIYAVQEGSFLAGALAGMMTQTDKIGFIGGVDIEIMHDFRHGYNQGAQHTNPLISIHEEFISVPPDFSGFKNPAAGYARATEAYRDGVDIIYAAAGLSGNGVMQAAKDSDRFAIGVDSDQDHLARGFILTSMLKRLDNATYSEVSKILDGSFAPGVNVYGLKEHGVGLSEMKYTRQRIPPEVLRRLAEIETGIISGSIKISEKPSTPPMINNVGS